MLRIHIGASKNPKAWWAANPWPSQSGPSFQVFSLKATFRPYILQKIVVNGSCLKSLDLIDEITDFGG